MGDGSESPYIKPVPISYEITSLKAPPGWQLYLMPGPSWPHDNPPLPAVRCGAGDVLPLSPGPRALVAVQGALDPDGSIGGKPFLVWDYPLDMWHKEEVLPDSKMVAYRRQLEIEVEPGLAPGDRLGISLGELYGDADGRWFEDGEGTSPVRSRFRRWWAVVGGGAIGALLFGAWALRRRLRARRRPTS
jgi:hypothetical protein